MQCPGCGLYHPARYDQCVSCGRRFDGSDSGSNTSPPSAAAGYGSGSQRSGQEPLDASDARYAAPGASYNSGDAGRPYGTAGQGPTGTVPSSATPPGSRAQDRGGTPASASRQPGAVEDGSYYDDHDDDDDELHDEEFERKPQRGKKERKSSRAVKAGGKKKGVPVLGLVIAAGILLASAGGTYFFLSRPPESERLLAQGQKELANGQFAFAQKTLEDARSRKPNDARILMSLARAYVGTDQVEKAWSCISEAQQTGPGVMTDPQLTSDLAKYYVQRNQYSRAVELLRPLAEQNIAHKKTELADLDALWGDACFNKGETEQALKCWEEIKSLGEGSRFNEVDTRLASIYQKMSNELLAKDDVEGALKCLNSLNTIAPSPQSYERVAELYSKQDKLDLAIDQIRQAIKLGNGSRQLNKKLASYLSKRGKQLLDSGDTETGYAYLQQAQGYDSSMKVPSVVVRAMAVNVDALTGTVHTTGEVWNPGPNTVSYLSIKAELYDSKTSQSIWAKEQKVVDEFVAPLQPRDARQFQLDGPLTGSTAGLEVRVYLDGNLYKSYPLDASAAGAAGSGGQPSSGAAGSAGNLSPVHPGGNNAPGTGGSQPAGSNGNISGSSPGGRPNAQPGLWPGQQPSRTPSPISHAPAPVPAPAPAYNSGRPAAMPGTQPLVPPSGFTAPGTAGQQTPNQSPGLSPEERTLKDLE